jgi:carboxymethylenebutenolidase
MSTLRSPITVVTPRSIWARLTALKPLLMHLAEEDEFISKAAQAEIKAALASKRNATIYSYPGQHHAFARHNGAHYNAAAAKLANGRTSEFLHQQLR